jgi:bis(5'-nucleosyl)-tetraphosphatase (symmetrical)
MAIYAVGDIQGCYEELKLLLQQIEFSENDQLWVAGDLVNRGPHSLETLRFIKSLGSRATCVLGNHDLHLLAIYFGATQHKRSDTLTPILQAPDKHELLTWLCKQKLMVYDRSARIAMVHAGIPPCWSIHKAQKRAKEVEKVLKSTLAGEFFNHVYGNQPDLWSSHHKGWNRLRLITNYLTRMRFCTSDGKLDFSAKGNLGSQPKDHKPWFQFPRKDPSEQGIRILFGHWAALEGDANAHNVFALDTGCVWGGKLTALRLDDMQLFSTPSIMPKPLSPETNNDIKVTE